MSDAHGKIQESRSQLRAGSAKLVNALSPKELRELFGISRVADLTGLDTIGLPVYSAVRALSASISIHTGKGLTHEASRAGAILEAIEFEVAENPQGPFRIASAMQIPAEDRLPLEDCFPARASIVNDMIPLAWEEVVNINNGAPKLIPSDLIWLTSRIPHQSLMYLQTGTNGLASGATLEDAILSGLYEILERDAWTLNQFLMDIHGVLPKRTPLIDLPPRLEALVRRIESAQVRLHLFDITNDYRVATFSAILLDLSGNVAGTFGGYGCHLNAEIAAIRAITEAAQARCCYISGARDDLFRRQFLLMKRMDQRKLDDMFNELPIGSAISDYRKVRFAEVRTELRYLLKMIRQFGVSEVFVKDMGSVLGGKVHVVRVFSPQCEPFKFDHWVPTFRCLSYAERRVSALSKTAPARADPCPAPKPEEGEEWKNS
jgi:ribosomal protein S12 methylthiotransferase accessory factor